MQAICVADILSNSYIVVLGRVIQYSSGEGTFSGRVSSHVTISYSNTAGAVVVGSRLGRPAAVVSAHMSHANTPYSWRIPVSRQGFILLFLFIHNSRSFDYFQCAVRAVGGLLGLLAGC